MRPICYLKAKCSLRRKDITITARLELRKRSMKALNYRHNISTDRRSHRGDGAMPEGRVGKQGRETGRTDRDVDFRKWDFAAD